MMVLKRVAGYKRAAICGLAFASALSLAVGCKQIGEKASRVFYADGVSPTYVLGHGTKIKVQGRRALLYGTQRCPSVGLLDNRSYSNECVVIDSSTTEVPIIVRYLEPAAAEAGVDARPEWATVTRDPRKPGGFGLRRVDGTYLLPQ